MTQDLRAQIADLSARLSRLEAERAVIDTLNRYGHSIDYGDEPGWLDCFTRDGVFDLHTRVKPERPAPHHAKGVAHDKGVRFAGREALASFVAGHTRAPGAWHKHVMVEPIVTVSADGRTASSRCYFQRIDERDGQRVIVAFGRYLDQLVLGEDGRWRLRERIAEIESFG